MVAACNPCRKRKVKCDGSKPICIQCKSREKHCTYDKVLDKRRRSHTDFEDLARRFDRAKDLLTTIAEGGSKSDEIIKMLQLDICVVESFSNEEIKQEVPFENIELENKLLRSDAHGKISFYGETSNMPMIAKTALKAPLSLPAIPNDFFRQKSTHVAGNFEDRILELLNLYFTWQHSYYNIFDKDLFLRDMQTNGPYFSEFLLHAILTHAHHFSDQYNESRDLEDPFYKKAIQMLPKEFDNASISTIQGLLLLASKESGIGKTSLGWIHSGIAFRLAIDLGLHLDGTRLRNEGTILEEEDIVRQATFWGCYIFDLGWSFYLGRPTAMQKVDIMLRFPDYIDEPSIPWTPFYENDDKNGSAIVEFYPTNTRTAIIKLYLILNDIINSVYSTSFKVNKTQNYFNSLKFCYKRLLEWKMGLPKPLQYGKDTVHPAVIMLHTMYYAAVVLLFRPFFKLSGSSWTNMEIPDPLEMGKTSAISIIELLQSFGSLYSLAKVPNLAVYVSSTASTVFLTMPSFGVTDGSDELLTCHSLLAELCRSWPDAKSVYNILTQKLEGEEDREYSLQNDQYNDLQEFIFGSDFYLDWNILTP